MARKRKTGGQGRRKRTAVDAPDAAESLDQAFAAAVGHYRRGRLAAAEKVLLAIQRQRPNFPDVLHLLALIALKGGRNDDAIGRLRAAVVAAPQSAELHNLLGGALRKAGRTADAIAAYERAIDLDPNSADAEYNLGNALRDQDRVDDAIFRYRRATELNPEFGDAHYNLGLVLRTAGRPSEAAAVLETATRLNPTDVEALLSLANAHADLGAIEKALAACDHALAIKPDFAEAHFNRGNLLTRTDRADDAVASFRRALALDPGMARAHDRIGVLHHRLGQFDEAMASFQQAIAIDPNLAEAHANLGQLLMLHGNMKEGWRELEWRWRGGKSEKKSRPVPQPPWRGEPIAGKTLLVWGEQGVGDEILFASIVPDLVDAGARVVLECERRMIPLYERSFAGVECVAQENPPLPRIASRDIHYQIAIGNLGCWMRPSLESFPRRDRYLIADPTKRDGLRAKYRGSAGEFLVGVAWISKNKNIGGQKSMDVGTLASLARVAGVRLVDLQYGDTATERAAFERAAGNAIVHDDDVDQMADLDAFAAQVAAMDLVVSISNTTVHMAGALGVPTWVMLNSVPLAVWMAKGDTSPWYPSVRLFRQRRAGDWSEVVERVAGELEKLAAG